jgi:organic radical activating enzyme
MLLVRFPGCMHRCVICPFMRAADFRRFPSRGNGLQHLKFLSFPRHHDASTTVARAF